MQREFRWQLRIARRIACHLRYPALRSLVNEEPTIQCKPLWLPHANRLDCKFHLTSALFHGTLHCQERVLSDVKRSRVLQHLTRSSITKDETEVGTLGTFSFAGKQYLHFQCAVACERFGGQSVFQLRQSMDSRCITNRRKTQRRSVNRRAEHTDMYCSVFEIESSAPAFPGVARIPSQHSTRLVGCRDIVSLNSIR